MIHTSNIHLYKMELGYYVSCQKCDAIECDVKVVYAAMGSADDGKDFTCEWCEDKFYCSKHKASDKHKCNKTQS